MNKHINWQAAVIAGGVAGIVSGLVKLGWENVLPPRTPARDKTNPPQRLLEQFGVPSRLTHATYTYSEQQLPWVSYLIHFGFSTSFAVFYTVAGRYVLYSPWSGNFIWPWCLGCLSSWSDAGNGNRSFSKRSTG